MLDDLVIELVRNHKTGTYFVFLEEVPGERWRVVNQAGDMLLLSADLFDEEPELISGPQIQQKLTAEQVKKVEAFNQQEAAIFDRIQAAQQQQHKTTQQSNETAKARPRSSRSKLPPSGGGPQRQAVEWSSSKLSFFRHRIDPLPPSHVFTIHVHGQGSFRMSKEQFGRAFSDVILSSQYKQQGIYSYDSLPAKAEAFKLQDL